MFFFKKVTVPVLLTDFQDVTFLPSLPTWHLGSQKSIMTPPQMKGRKNWYMTLKSAWLAFDTARYKGKGKSHCIPDPQKNPLKWIAGWDPVWHKSWHWWHSPWVLGYLAWTRRLLGLYQWALAHPLGAPKPCRLKNWRGWQHIWACDGFYFSQAWYYRLQSPAQQYQWSWPRWYSFTGKNKMTPAPPLTSSCKFISKQTFFLFFFLTRLRSICTFSLVLHASQVLTSNRKPLFLSSVLRCGENWFQLIGNFASGFPGSPSQMTLIR